MSVDRKSPAKPIPVISIRDITRLLTVGLLMIAATTPAFAEPTNQADSAVRPEVFSGVDWYGWATSAWGYYQPGVGVHSTTGLHRSVLTSYTCVTDWDIGSHIYSVIYARKLNLITDSGSWQFDDRIGKLLNFLQNRPLGSNKMPYRVYSWDGQACSSSLTNAADAGRLLAALYALKKFKPTYTSTVDAIFNRSKTAFDTLSKQLGVDYYAYLAAEGFAGFGYGVSATFNAIDTYSGSYVTVYGQSLPSMQTLAEPIIHTILEGGLSVHPPGTKFLDFASRVFAAQSGRYSNTGLLTAFTEGTYPATPGYLYEWIIYPGKTSQQWVLGNSDLSKIYNYSPLAYTKVALAYLAIYGETPFTLALVNAAKNLATSNGFGEAVQQNGSSGGSLWGSDPGAFYTDKTNQLVLAAAALAGIQQPPPPPTNTPAGFFHPSTGFWFSWYDMRNAEWDAIHFVNVAAQTATIQIAIGTSIVDKLTLGAGEATYRTYSGVANGPVHVTSDQLIWVTQRVVGWTAMQEIYGMPGDVASAEIIWTWYDNTQGTSDIIYVINPNASQANVDIYVAGILRGQLSVPAGQVRSINFPNIIGGPLKVVSNIPVLASQRVTGYNDFAEIIGLPVWYTFTETWFTWYDMASADWDAIHMLNPGDTTASVSIYVGGALRVTFDLAPRAADYKYFPGVMGGPVRVSSTQPIWVTQRIVGWGGWKEVFGVPTSLSNSEWFFTWYDSQSAQWNGIHVINPGARSVQVQVYVGGVLRQTITVGPGQAAYAYYSGLMTGPVRLVSSGPIISSQRILGWSSFEETLGASLTTA
jgi:hypothetical protein